MSVTFTNLSAAAVGLWDVAGVHHVAKAMGGSVTLDPDEYSQQIIGVYESSGTGSSVTIEAPENTTLPSISGVARVGETLTGNAGVWTGSPSLSYAWLADGAEISGETSSTYVIAAGNLGKAIALRVDATNAAGDASATSSATAAVVAALSAPVNTVAPVVSGIPTVGQALASTTGTWTGNPTPTYTRQWLRGGTAINGATAASYTLVAADIGAAISVRVTGTNSAGNAQAASNALGPVVAADPDPEP